MPHLVTRCMEFLILLAPPQPGKKKIWKPPSSLSLIPSFPNKLWLILFPSYLEAGENECPGEVDLPALIYLWIPGFMKQSFVSLAGKKVDSSKADKIIWLFTKLKNGIKGLRTLSRHRDPWEAWPIWLTYLPVLNSQSPDPDNSTNLSSFFITFYWSVMNIQKSVHILSRIFMKTLRFKDKSYPFLMTFVFSFGFS